MTTSDTAVLLCGHGSRDIEAISEFEAMAEKLAARLPQYRVGSAYLEFARPMIRDGLAALREAGARRVLAVPGMLFAAGHVKNDLPWEINSYAAEHPEMSIEFGRDLAIDAKLIRAASERIETCERSAKRAIRREDTALLVVGRGTNDPDANSNVSKVARMLWEGMGFGWAEAAYSGVTAPLVDAALARAAHLGFRRIVVFPYFLFTGVLVKRIYHWTDEAALANPGIEFLKADYLNGHPLVLDTFVDRVEEALSGTGNMNCQMCKYREQVIGFEGDRGAPQVGHHHHVRGIGADAGHAHSNSHDHDHDHSHDHYRGHSHGRAHRPGDGK
jgi:sirohydrochlorin cobaltochelatase